MNPSLAAHIKEIKNNTEISLTEIEDFLHKFDILTQTGINSNFIFYILNLSDMTYSYINDVCNSFTGKTTTEFYKKGVAILPEIIVPNDLKVMSTLLFPKMNARVAKLPKEEITKVVFEIHYSMLNAELNKITPMVEYSSYTLLDDDGKPVLSTGMCFESVLHFEGVRGIVRINRKAGQETLFDETINHISDLLTKKEKEITNFLMEGLSRKEVADKLNISYLTVNTHVKKIYKKLDIHKISDLVNFFKTNH